MEPRLILFAALALALGAGPVAAQSIDVVADPAGTHCSGYFAPFQSSTLYIIARSGPEAPAGIMGAEFWVSGLPDGWVAVVTPNPNEVIPINPEFPFKSSPPYRASIYFPTCQPYDASGNIVLFTVQVIAMSTVGETYLQAEVARPPSDASFGGPMLFRCDAPTPTAVEVQGGAFIINGGPCTVGVEEKTWGEVKGLYE